MTVRDRGDSAESDAGRGGTAWAGRRVLVTGAGGFIGRRLTRHLAARGAIVTRLVHASRGSPPQKPELLHTTCPVIAASITDLPSLATVIEHRRISDVFHLAALNSNRGTGLSPYMVFETNARGTYTVLEACRLAPSMPRTVVLSSREAEECFSGRRDHAMHPYAASKAAAELAATSFAETFGLQIVTLRTGNVYGAGDLNWNRLVPSAIRSVIAGEAPAIHGSPELRRDYIHVDDVVLACLAASDHSRQLPGPERIVRISSGVSTSTLEIVQKIALAAGRPDLDPAGAARLNPAVAECQIPLANGVALLGWTSKVDLDDGLARTIRWYRRFLERVRRGRTVT